MLLAAAALALAGNLSAANVTWTLSGVDFDSDFNYGGALTGLAGSFVYDADTNTLSSVSITGNNGLLTNAVFVGQNNILVTSAGGPDLTGLGFADLGFVDSMTNAGGTSAVSFVYSGTCANAGCDRFNTADAIQSGRGSIVGEAGTPEPGSIFLLGSGLFGILGVARRRR